MKRTIKRTEITIETVEITTIRRSLQEAGDEEAFRNVMADPRLMLSTAAEPAQQVRQIEIEEKKEK
ncbi:MAG TPA: hypothetical protein VMZ26_04725 [Pyrinomonadaceae bacterium]|nr:hypothetical protein [Pyrinomonadaceae bacterium]